MKKFSVTIKADVVTVIDSQLNTRTYTTAQLHQIQTALLRRDYFYSTTYVVNGVIVDEYVKE